MFCLWRVSRTRIGRRATATRTPQNKRFNEQKQSLCACVFDFGTFLCRPLQNNNVIWPNFMFSGKSWAHDGNFFFFFSPYFDAFHSNLSQERSPAFSKLNKLESSQKNHRNEKLYFKMTFSLPLPSSLVKLPIITSSQSDALNFPLGKPASFFWILNLSMPEKIENKWFA